MEQFELSVVDNATLKGLSWEIKEPKGYIVIMQGMEEHIARYDVMAKYLNKEGYSVYGLDCYGQGLNVKEDLSNRGVWPKEGFAKQVIANNMLVEKLKKNGLPVYIFAHSMGSFMAQDYMERFPGTVEKVVLCGSGYKNVGVPIAFHVARPHMRKGRRNKKSKVLNGIMFGNFNKKIKNPRTAFDWLSHNEENVDKYIADPLCGFGPNCGFCLEFLRGMNRLYKKNVLNAINKEQKIFIISGSEDPVTNYGAYVPALKNMYNKLGVKNVDTKIYENLRHEICNEDRKEEVFADVTNFFNK